jgi:hypothetical protein
MAAERDKTVQVVLHSYDDADGDQLAKQRIPMKALDSDIKHRGRQKKPEHANEVESKGTAQQSIARFEIEHGIQPEVVNDSDVNADDVGNLMTQSLMLDQEREQKKIERRPTHANDAVHDKAGFRPT